MRPIFTLNRFFFVFVFLFFAITAFSQTTGDYRSNTTSGNWTTLASWQYYNGSTWVAATTYPGQNTGTGTVTILDSHVITINTSITNSFTSLVIGSGVSGELFIASNVTVNTSNVRIMANGIMSFDKNKTITFPVATSFLVSSGGKLYAENSDCSNQTALYIGSAKVSACTGSGGGALSNFSSFSNGGGTGSATSNTPVCSGNPLILTAIPPVATSGSYTYTYKWSGPGIYYNPNFSSSAVYTIDNVGSSNQGTYSVEIKRNDGFVSTVSTNVSVNTAIAAPTNTRSDNVNWCTATIRWDGAATNFNLDVATSNTFSAGSILSSYNNLSVGNVRDLVLSGLSPNTTYYFRVKSSGNCASTSYSPVASFTTMSIAAPIANSGYGSCNDWVAQWNGVYDTSGNEADGYYLDVAIDNSFTNYVSGYQNLYVDKANNRNYTITGLALGGVYYYRLRANTACGTGGNSNVISFTLTGNGSSTPGTITGGANSICVGSTATFVKDANTWPSTGTWSVFNQTGSANITQSGVVTGVSVGTVKVVFTTYNGGCGTSTSRDLTVTPGSVVGTASSSPNLCIGETMINVTHTTTGATGIGMATNLPAGVYASWSSNTITISGTPTNAGTFNYSIPLTGGCSGINATGIITVTSVSAPTAGTPTNPTCKVPTGSVLLSNLPSSGTIVQTGERSENIAITTGGSQTITGLLPGTYYFAVNNGSCTSATVSVIIATPENNTWSSGSWSNGTPTISQRLVFASDYTNANDVDLVGCSCQVTGSTVVTIKSGRTLKIENGVEVQPNSTLTFENNASLIQINDDAVNSGNIRYHRHTAPVKRYDFTYWSSPVAGQTMKALSPNTLGDKYYSYNNGWKIEYNGALTMAAGKGYIIRAPQTFSITVPAIDTNPVFVGMPNNGLISFSIAANQTHLLGNPYPSAIDADKFIAANSTSLEGTLYFWTHNTSPSKDIAGDAIYNYTTNDYITYNKTGGVNVATGKIAAGQGFFAPASAAGGTIVFNNAMRYTEGQPNYDNSQFLKMNTASKAVTTTTTTEKNRVWLNLTNSEGAFKQTLVGYITGATNAYDAGYDGMSYDGNQFVDFYSINNAVNLSIQGRALPFVKQDSVVLGYKSTIKGDFKISIDHTDGTLSTQNIFLEDKDLKVLHNLKQGAYTFSTEKGVFNNRFVLRYVDKNAVEPVVEAPVVEIPVVDSTVTVSVNQDQITVSSSEDLISTIIIYDITGKIIYQKDNVSANDFMIQNLLSSQQVLLVTLVLEKGKVTSTKIVY